MDSLDSLIERVDAQIALNRLALEGANRLRAQRVYAQLTYESKYGEPPI